MAEDHRPPSLFTCPACGSVRVDRNPECECPDWVPVESVAADIREPDLEVILRDIFGMGPLGLEVCLCLMDAGAASIAEVTDAVDADRSTVNQHITHLVDIGVLEPDERIRPEGGRVTVFRTVPPEVVRNRFRRALYQWLRAAIAVVDTLTAEKVGNLAEVWTDDDPDTDATPDDSADQIYYRP